jgi:hypothetical protein
VHIEASFEMNLSTGELQCGHVVSSSFATHRLQNGSTQYTHACEKLTVTSLSASGEQYTFPVIVCGALHEQHNNSKGSDKRGLHVDNSSPRPTVLYGYGSYGVPIPTRYLSEVAVLMHRGWNIAFACVRCVLAVPCAV